MTKETLLETAQRLIESGNLNLHDKTYNHIIGGEEETLTIESLQFFYKDDLNEIAALAVLDGSIRLDEPNPWRPMSEFPFEDVPIDVKDASGAIIRNVINAGGFIELADKPLVTLGNTTDYTHWRIHEPDANPWRSVEDEEPPKDGTCILVYGSLLNEPKTVVWCDLNKGWRLALADLGFEGTKSLILEYPFTHWMPLPAPPVVL
jgi:hypothetical protein